MDGKYPGQSAANEKYEIRTSRVISDHPTTTAAFAGRCGMRSSGVFLSRMADSSGIIHPSFHVQNANHFTQLLPRSNPPPAFVWNSAL
jgi:hypothetical protein